MITVKGLSKGFSGIKAVDDISFSVPPGEVFGFLGPNGAGKTTTINMLTGLARPDQGTIRIGGMDCSQKHRAAQHLIGVVPDESNLYPELTGFGNLCFCGALYGMPRQKRINKAQELLEVFGLKQAADRKFGGYSKGMKRKLTIAAGIIHEPQILFLDEPTTGLDVASARQLRQLISDLHQNGTTIFLTTHYIEEAQRLCDRIAFIVSGRIVKIDTVENLLQPIRNKHVVQIVCVKEDDDIHHKLAESFADMNFIFAQKDTIRIEAEKPILAGAVVRFLEEHGVEVSEARRVKPSLEDVFVDITGIEADAMKKEKEKAGMGSKA
ncbi:ATP-binding cassette domain-containing protein [candidate division KSB1 bacterium]|nr:ATP-binding cassette domain-containing protein [candidate division KSB1 bacterium]